MRFRCLSGSFSDFFLKRLVFGREIVYNEGRIDKGGGAMEPKIVRPERETDCRGRQIMYDIFTTCHEVQNETVLPHTHTYFELLLVEEGVAVDTCGDAPLDVRAGDVALVAPNVVHNICHSVRYGRYRSTVVKFSPLFLYPLEATQSDVDSLFTQPKFALPTYLFRAGSEDARLLGGMMRDIWREWDEKQVGWELGLRARLTGLYLYLVRRLAPTRPAAMSAGTPIPTDSALKLKKAISYMEENYAYSISMQEVADLIGMSYCQFSRFFPRMTGKNFSAYLSDIRLSRARKALLMEGKTVSDVAMECGFDYLSYFIGRFRRRYGITPYAFRRKYRSQMPSEGKE